MFSNRLILTVTPFLIIHVFVLGGVLYKSLILCSNRPAFSVFTTPFSLTCSFFSEIIVLFFFYGFLALFNKRWSKVMSGICLYLLLSASAIYYIVTIKTRVVYGVESYIDEMIPFLFNFVPSYINFYTIIIILFSTTLVFIPYVLSLIIDRSKVFRIIIVTVLYVSLSLGILGWTLPTSGQFPEYLRSGPLKLLLSASLVESRYKKDTINKQNKADSLLYLTLDQPFTVDPPHSLLGQKPFKKIILYQLEGIPEFVFRPDSKFISVLPMLAQWSRHAIQMTNYYTMSSLTGHAHQSLITGGYLRSGSRFEILHSTSLSMVKPLLKSGLETAFFYSGDASYRGISKTFHDWGFQRVFDIDDFPESYKRKGRFIDDMALIDGFSKWVDGKDKYFVIISPMNSHGPYWNPEGRNVEYDGNNEFQSFLSALSYQDKVLGQLVDFIDKNQPDALLVILSDHGVRQYFPEIEEHNPPFSGIATQFESVFHVPLYFYNKHAIPEPEKCGMVMSHVDTMPTVLTLMGREAKEKPLAGKNIFLNQPRVHFFNTQHNHNPIGLMDGCYKFIFDVKTGKFCLYLCDQSGTRWEVVDWSEEQSRIEHYKGLANAWQNYLIN